MSTSPFELPEIDSLADLLPAFEFEHLIAHGGMGAVYKARQLSLDRDVAIKILPRELGQDPLFRSSFEAEAKAMARLAHPNLIRVFDSGDVDGLLYIVMEYVPGKSLFHSAHGKAIDPKQAVEIIIAACKGLSHAHENGIVHRDIKPANILLTPEREPKIGDFGLARCTRTDADGLAMGTPAYMAPEITNQPEKGDPQSDIYAIGVVLRELLTGIPAGTMDPTKMVISDFKLACICRKATHADPSLRYLDAASFAEQLTRWMATAGSKSKALNTVRQSSLQHPAPAKKPALLASQTHSSTWALMRNCATIAVLLGAIHLLWGVYNTKQANIARLQQEQDAKPPIVKVIRVERKAVAQLVKASEVNTALAVGNME